MKTRSKILIGFGLAVVVVAAVFFLLLANLDTIVKAAIEKFGSEAAGVPVRVGQVEISLKEATGAIRGLTVANPAGFSGPPAFQLGEVDIRLNKESLTSEVPVIESLRILSPEIRYVVAESGQSNLGVIRSNLERATAGGPQPESSKPEGKKVKLKIRRLVIDEPKAEFDLAAVGGKTITGEVGTITLTDLGGKEGITPGNLADVILGAMIRSAEREAASRGLTKALGAKAGKTLEELQQKLEEKTGPGAAEPLKNLLGR